MLKSVSDTLALRRIKEKQGQQVPPVRNAQTSLVTTTVQAAIEVLRESGMVVAIEVDENASADLVHEVVAIFRTGRNHAPGRMRVLEDEWPSLAEALANLADAQERE